MSPEHGASCDYDGPVPAEGGQRVRLGRHVCRPHGRIAGGLIALLVVAAMPSTAGAQYFGQNKVQYETFDFQVLTTEHFDVYYYPEEQAGARLAARMAERWYARLSGIFGFDLSSRQPLILYASSSDFQQTNVIGGTLGEGTGGVTESVRRRIVLPLAGPLADTDHVIGHELVHAFQYDMAAQSAAGRSAMIGISRLPLWFIEGMAEYFSIGPRSPLTAMWMRDAVARETIPTIDDLNDPRYFPYRWGHALWAYVGGRWGSTAIVDTLRAGMELGDANAAFAEVLGLDTKALSTAWQEALRDTFEPVGRNMQPASAYGRALTPADEGQLGGSLNVSPALSPDGRWVAFLSERGLFSVDLYVADVETGETIRRVTRTAVDPHVESLQFISSAGAWSPDSRQLAVTAVVAGRPVLAIYDVEDGSRARELPLAGLDGALNPAWSPDGTRVAFVGMSGGLTDLFVVDLGTGSLTRLTEDAYADLQPAWSPDGSRLAFSTDRFSTGLEDLAVGDLQLAVIDVRTKHIERVTAFAAGKHISAQWSADGRQLYFVATPDGIPNLYRVGLDGAVPERLTALMTGVSGITESSPALSVSRDTVAFSVFEDGAYRLYAAGVGEGLTGAGAMKTGGADADFATLPPVSEAPRALTTTLDNATTGLPPASDTPPSEPYHARFGLDAVGQPSIAVGADRFGTYAGGGVSLLFSDMLGDQNLAVAFQSMSSFDGDFGVDDLGGGVMYMNKRHRWNWGVVADQTPYRTGFISETAASVDGEPAIVQQAVVSRQTDRGVTGIASYPLNRAQRIELSGAFRQLRFEDRVRTTAYSLASGDVIFDERRDLSDFPSLDLGQASAALVYDTASFGATGPVLGQRYRAEVSPMFGSLRYTGVLADYRRYFMPVRLYTIATRVMHYGRYGGDADDSRLFPLFLGYPSLVRGYDVGTFRGDECPPTPDGRCAAFDRLLGSRLLVANVEFRFPLLRPFGLRQNVYGPVPIEVAFFADAGVAWSQGQKPEMFGGDREAVSSAGAAFRVNALGFAVLQLSFARPFRREDQGWVFQFSLSPGF